MKKLLTALLILSNISFAAILNCEYNYKEIEMAVSTTTKTVNLYRHLNGISIKYHLNDFNNFNEVDDYIELSNDRGHKVTYPLKCKKMSN